MTSVNELNEKRNGLIAEARKIWNDANGLLNDEQKATFDTLTKEADELESRVGRLARLEGHESFLNSSRGRQTDPQDVDLPKEVNTGYSLLRAIRCVMENRPLDGLEGEVSRELEKRNGRKPGAGGGNGFFMPRNLPRLEQRAFDNTTYGGGLISSDYLDPQNFIELLRNRMVVKQAGARVVTGMAGIFAFPAQTAASALYWVAAGSNVTGSQPTTNQVQFIPKTAGALTDIYRKTILQSSLDAEQMVRDDLAKVLAIGVDYAALNGSGTSNQPLGILQNTNITNVPLGTNGAAPTWQALLDQKKTVAIANADIGKLAYVTNPQGEATFKQTAKIGSTYPVFLMDDDGDVNGYPCYVTNQMPANLTKGTGTNLSSVIFGNWEDLVIAQWGDIDVLVDPYTGSAAGTLRVVMLLDLDIQVRHTGSFATINDMITL